jgi:molecular chaperone DnaK
LSDPIVGIDLGTSNSVVAHADAAGNVRVLADDAGGKVHPSVVSFHPNGGVVIGAAAKQRKVIDPQNTIYSVKRLIGRAFRSPEVQTTMARSPFLIKEGPNNAPLIVTRGGEFAVPEISAIVLDHVRNVAAARLETAVHRAVVTVPASFNDAQRSATATAGAIAGLTVVRVLNEPTAAALAYGHTRQLREIIAVYDFGGGTFDITLLRLDDQVYEVLGTSGDTFLGGDDLDERLVEKMVAKFLTENRIDLRTNEVAMMRLRSVAEQTKIELSRRSRAVVRIDEIAYGPRGVPLNLQIEIARDEFIREVSDLIDRTFPVCSEALKLAGLGFDQIADVILVGGSTKIPYVRDQVARFFGKAPRTDVNPEDAVAAGAALQAIALERILSRRPSSRIQVPAKPRPGDEETTANAGVLELVDRTLGGTGATMAPSELSLPTHERPRRPTSGYPATRPPTDPTRPDTSYSVTRAGVRDAVAEPERYPAAPPRPPSEPSFETRTPPPSQPIGRITRPVATVPPPLSPQLPSPQHASLNKTALGVPTAPAAFEVDLESGALFPEHPLARPTTAPGTAAPPPLPHRSGGPKSPLGPHQTTTPLPVDLRGSVPRPPQTYPVLDSLDEPAAAGNARTQPEMRATRNPATTQPMAPTTPIAPPTAPTMTVAPDYAAASTARGMGAQRATAEPSPATTARGFQPPQTVPGLSPAASPPVGRPRPTTPTAPPSLYAQAQPPMQLPMPSQQLPYPQEPPPQPYPQAASQQPYPQAASQQPYPQAQPQQQPYPQAQPPPSAMPMPPRPAPVLLEVTPRGLGIATVAGFCEELIRRNARIPMETRKLFTTSRDRQDVVRIVVCQGESRRLDNNTVIGDLVLQNLPPRPRGETSIEVTFSLDASGVLHVRARDAQTGAEQRATLALVGDVAQEDVAASRDRLQQLRR